MGSLYLIIPCSNAVFYMEFNCFLVCTLLTSPAINGLIEHYESEVICYSTAEEYTLTYALHQVSHRSTSKNDTDWNC